MMETPTHPLPPGYPDPSIINMVCCVGGVNIHRIIIKLIKQKIN